MGQKPKVYKFIILKNYSDTRHYEILEGKKNSIQILLEKLGLKKTTL